MKKIIATVLTFGMLLSLCGCFPTKSRSVDRGTNEKITFEQLAQTPAHVNKTLKENLVIDADVNVKLKGGFDMYKAKPVDYSMDLLQSVFMKNKKITEDLGHDYTWGRIDESSAIIHSEKGYFKVYDFRTKEDMDRELSYFYHNNYGLKPNRDELFPMKELDFMSSADATAIFDSKIRELNIPVSKYHVFPVDCEFMKKSDEEEIEKLGESGIIYHNKDDEFYLIEAEVDVPNGSTMAGMSVNVRKNDSNWVVMSGNVYGVVGKNGLLSACISGCYDCAADGKADSIISLDSAVSKVEEKYKNVDIKNPLKINTIELSYLPYLLNIETGEYALKPTWIFRFVEDLTKESELDVDYMYLKVVFDAVTGEEVLLS